MDLFNTIDWAAIVKIVGVDIMLGVDNAIVIALACAALPAALVKRAIFWGTFGAVALRIILLIGASYIIDIPYLKIIAGGYLVYLGYKLLVDYSSDSDSEHDIESSDKLLNSIKIIVIADFMMSLDNVLAVTAASQSAGAHSTIYAIAGVIFSIPIILFGANIILNAMEKFPIIISLGSGLLAYVGAEMLFSDPFVLSLGIDQLSHFQTQLIAMALGIIMVVFAKLTALEKAIFE